MGLPYTIIGFMTRGDSIRQQIAALPTTTNPIRLLEPTTPVLIENMSMITDTQDAALELSAPASAAGQSFTVTVTLSDGNSADTTTKTFTVKVAANTSTDPPYLQAIPNITTTAGTAYTLPNLTTWTYVSSGASTNYAYDPGTPANGAVAINDASFSNSTGGFTVTPKAGFVGVSDGLGGRRGPRQ